ncbi:hypothetical protein GCM10019016_129420 [Streptomyces prasinosporus]|uniref:PDZ domain-containing protein n=1 Tax=Streptomyces prasinosporus TaxID=68256 RepID=A0ABP6UED5_9ACTN
MEQTVLRPKPMPGRERGGSDGDGGDRPGSGSGPGGGGARSRTARRRGRRLVSAASGTLVAALLVLSGAGLGAMGATIAGAGAVAGPERRAGTPAAASSASAASAASSSSASPRSASAAAVAPPAPVVARLGVEVADDGEPGALVVGVHVPGPASSAGLVRGDVLLAFGGTRVDSAADLARAVARARPGAEVSLTARRQDGSQQQLSVVPGLVT